MNLMSMLWRGPLNAYTEGDLPVKSVGVGLLPIPDLYNGQYQMVPNPSGGFVTVPTASNILGEMASGQAKNKKSKDKRVRTKSRE